MVVKVNIVAQSLVMVLLWFTTLSQSQRCHRSPQTSFGCSFVQLLSEDAWCVVEKHDNPDFSFYIKPGHDFQGLKIRTSSPVGQYELILLRGHAFKESHKWYQIRFWKDGGLIADDYHLSIVGQTTLTTRLLIGTSKLMVMVNGSPFYSADCNPDNFQEPQKTIIPNHSVVTPLNLFSPALIDTPSTASATIGAVTPANPPSATGLTENELDLPLFMGDLHNFHNAWWIYAIAGTTLLIIIVVVVIVLLAMRKKKQVNDNASSEYGEKGLSNMAYNDPEWQTNGDLPPPNFYGSDNPVNHIYEDPNDYNDGEHIYESVEALNVRGYEGQSFTTASADRWQIINQPQLDGQSRRGSTHDSENSLYGCVINRVT